MQDFGEHGREFISPEVGLRLMRLLADEAALAVFCEAQGLAFGQLREVLKDVVFKVCARVLPALQPGSLNPFNCNSASLLHEVRNCRSEFKSHINIITTRMVCVLLLVPTCSHHLLYFTPFNK